MKIESTAISEAWIGLAHVRIPSGTKPFPDNVKGAYVNVVALAKNESEFRKKVEVEFSLDNIILVDLEEIDKVSNYKREDRIINEIRTLVNNLSNDRPIGIDIFNTYSDDDA